MTLLDEIIGKCSPALIASRDHQAIADAVNVGRVKVVTQLGGIGLVMDALGPVAGGQLLDTLEALSPTNSVVKWAFFLIKSGTLDFGLASTRGMIDLLVPAPANAALKALAEVPDPVGIAQIEVAMKDATGAYL